MCRLLDMRAETAAVVTQPESLCRLVRRASARSARTAGYRPTPIVGDARLLPVPVR